MCGTVSEPNSQNTVRIYLADEDNDRGVDVGDVSVCVDVGDV